VSPLGEGGSDDRQFAIGTEPEPPRVNVEGAAAAAAAAAAPQRVLGADAHDTQTNQSYICMLGLHQLRVCG